MSDEVMHYGVKGMKWGVVRAEKKAAREAQDQEILKSRVRVQDRNRAVGAKMDKAITAYANGKTKLSDSLMAEANKMSAENLKHPDNATAAKMTRGEKRTRAVNTAIAIAVIAGGTAIKVKSG